MQKIVAAVGEDHFLACSFPFRACTNQFVAAVKDSHNLNLGQTVLAVQFALLRNGSVFRLKPVDQAGHVTRAKAIVDIHHRDVAGAAVEHPEEGGEAVEAGAVTYAGRHSDYGT